MDLGLAVFRARGFAFRLFFEHCEWLPIFTGLGTGAEYIPILNLDP